MHPAVYMTLTKVLIKSDARHSLLLDPTGQHLAVFCYIHKNIAVLFFLFFFTFHFFPFPPTDDLCWQWMEAASFTECLCQLS